ncbi:MAG: carboxymuconolactone decarboxylase family protein [Alloprevotella sp.]|nr:carboxymuconolactone decarboxylase family protein [Alloprevotella sp.]
MKLTRQQESLVCIAATEARGDLSALRQHLNTGLNAGLTVSEAKEALSQLYAYTGFPRSLNALGTLQAVLKEREERGLKTEAGREADALPADYDALRDGTAVQTRLTGQPFDYTFAPQTDYYLKAHLFGDIFARNNLTFADREVVTVSAIAALPGCAPQLQAHVRGALNMGVSAEALRQIPDVLSRGGLTAEADRVRGAIAQVVDGAKEQSAPVPLSDWPIGVPNDAYAQYFSGQSYVADVGGGVVNVTFEPGCRNNWHVHHGAVQVLICVAGRGWYQEWGKEPVELKPGVVVAVPEGVKHWHGAAADSWMQHLTYHRDAQPGASNEWLEPVE